MIPIKIIKEYTYLLDVVRIVRDGKKLEIDEFNLVGGRKSGKTTSIILFLTLLALVCGIKVGIMCFRDQVNSAMDLLDDIIQILGVYDIKYKLNKTRKEIVINGVTIKVVGVNNNRKGISAKKSGLPRFGDVDYAFMFFEERFEFDERDVMSIKEAVRSISSIEGKETKYVTINACNPWALGSPYITYCSKYQSWNINTLKTTGSQISIVKIPLGNGKYKTALFHYTNWRVNQKYLSQSEINQILDTWNYDKLRAATTDLGMPGYEQGAIYTHLLNNIGKAIYQEHETLIAGGDYGWGRDNSNGETVFHFGGYSQELGIDIYSEYRQNNFEITKSPEQVAKEVIEFYVNSMREYCSRIGWTSPFNLSVRVDNMAVGFISILNATARTYNINWLKFIKCKKFPVEDRIETTLYVMGKHMLRLNDNVKLLKSEFELSNYKEGDTQKRAKKHDHAINSFEYAIEPIMYKMAKYLGVKKLALKSHGGEIW